MPHTIMISGHAGLPKGLTFNDLNQSVTVTLEVDKLYGVIVWADCNLDTNHAQSYLSSVIKGLSLRDGLNLINKEIENHYYGKAQATLLSAILDAYKQYKTPHVVK
ncbi:DUF3870 domain-containing protein [Pseudalkalibacillus berkeleyi]|uniref:DUF3870 domain-containing protein n=1 Tax=Pseudalkalibacillus berkeleyi TaxID=1069813 RepID=A0ABS9GXS2_9BACL|nr:DUF3870 domain-containing protein [Pseudalkalibacillus berkeleyi]MCF6136398.1 DUF3870 domain-containing protein [Pseudalkalibacillus berkeleyi]